MKFYTVKAKKSCHGFATKFPWDQLQMDSEIMAAAFLLGAAILSRRTFED